MGRSSTLKEGDVINRTYTLVRLLGAGYSGTVWEARHACLPASFAVKVMHPEDRNNEHKSSRFRAEATTLFRLQHENLVRIWDANETEEGLFFLAMDLLEGETLTQRLGRGRLHPLRALKYAYGVACGLDAAHEVCVVHRDVKPDNLFILHDDSVKILDFTAGKFFLAGLRTTEPAAKVGTIAYMAPEFIDGDTTDASLDQYSLGLCLYTMFRGEHPFRRHFGNQFAMMKAQARETPEPLAKVADLPPWIDDLLAPALEKRATDRYPTMAHFGRVIREGMCRVARERAEGTFVSSVPLGKPSIDVEGVGGDRDSRSELAELAEPPRHTTAPVMPAERVSIAPSAMTDHDDGAETAPPAVASGDSSDSCADATVTVPLPAAGRPRAPAHRTTTAPVPPVMTTAPARRSPASRRWLAALVLALAVPAAGGLARRWGALRTAHGVAASASPAATAPLPAPIAAAARLQQSPSFPHRVTRDRHPPGAALRGAGARCTRGRRGRAAPFRATSAGPRAPASPQRRESTARVTPTGAADTSLPRIGGHRGSVRRPGPAAHGSAPHLWLRGLKREDIPP